MYHITQYCEEHDLTFPEVLCRILRGFRVRGNPSKREYSHNRLADEVFTGSDPMLPDWTREEVEDVLRDFPPMRTPVHCDALTILRRLGLANRPRKEAA